MSYIKEYTLLHPKEQRQLFYKRTYKAEHPTWDDSMIRLRDLVRERISTPVSVLDAGCGNGNFIIDELRDSFSRAVGIDVSPEETKKNVCLDEVVHGRLEKLPFAGETFDWVISLWVLEHVADPKGVFCELYRVLKPGGCVAFVTPNKHNWLIRLRQLMNYRIASRLVELLYGRVEDDTFDVLYRVNSIQDIQALARQTGFVIETLQENPDPSYTSFGPISYRLSSWMSSLNASWVKPHIICVVKKGI